MKAKIYIYLFIILRFCYYSDAQTINTFAGSGVSGYSGDGAAATAAKLKYPEQIVCDAIGNLYIADRHNHRIRKVDVSSGIISTIAGTGIAGFAGDGGLATFAQLNSPFGLAIDQIGNIYISDQQNYRIRKIDALTGIISTIAGTGTGGLSGDGGPAIAAQLDLPYGLAIHKNGDLFITDYNNSRIRKIDALTSVITTVAGTSAGFSGDGGLATASKLSFPRGVSIDLAGNLYIADAGNHRVRKVDATTNVITTFAGTGTGGYSGDGGAATLAELRFPNATVIDVHGNCYISDFFNHCIRKVDAVTGIITTYAGVGTLGYSGDGGDPKLAKLKFPVSLAIDNSCNIFISDRDNQRVRKISNFNAFTISCSFSNITCFGKSNGIATAIVGGASSLYTYSWSNSSTNISAINLNPGSHTVTVTDLNGCKDDTSVVITQPSAITSTITATNSNCAKSDGSATILSNGGAGGFTYIWSNGSTSATISGVSSGIFYVTVTDMSGCTAVDSIQVNNNSGVSSTIIATKTISCSGFCNGELTLNTIGGNSPFVYTWSNGNTTNASTGLCAGIYATTVTDVNGCTSVSTETLVQPAALTVNSVREDIKCKGDLNGGFSLNTNGGSSPYNYLWSNGRNQAMISGLGAGVYSVLVTDKNGCTVIVNEMLTEPDKLEAQVSSGRSCGLLNNFAKATSVGGVGPFQYKWNDGSNLESIVGVPEGIYIVTITDHNGCIATNSVNVLQGYTVQASAGIAVLNGATVTLSATGGNHYSWLPLSGLNCGNCSNPIAQVNETTRFVVEVVDENGCTDTASVVVNVDFNLFIPNAFSPNGDGQNDVFKLFCRGVRSFKFVVYNSWGEIVFETEDASGTWDGSYNGKILGTDVYTYQFTAIFEEGKSKQQSGCISLVR